MDVDADVDVSLWAVLRSVYPAAASEWPVLRRQSANRYFGKRSQEVRQPGFTKNSIAIN